MATLTVSLSGSGIINGSRSFTLSDANLQKLIDYMAATKGTQTPAQALAKWVDVYLIGFARDDVRSFVLEQAASQLPSDDFDVPEL